MLKIISHLSNSTHETMVLKMFLYSITLSAVKKILEESYQIRNNYILNKTNNIREFYFGSEKS